MARTKRERSRRSLLAAAGRDNRFAARGAPYRISSDGDRRDLHAPEGKADASAGIAKGLFDGWRRPRHITSYFISGSGLPSFNHASLNAAQPMREPNK